MIWLVITLPTKTVPRYSGGEVVGGVVGDAADGGRAVVVGDHLRGEAEAVVRLAEAGVVAAAEQLIDRLAVAVGGVEVAAAGRSQAERVDLAPGVLLERASRRAGSGRCCPSASSIAWPSLPFTVESLAKPWQA